MPLTLRPISCFGVLGAGTLGWRVGLRAALSGYEVLIHDVSERQIDDARRFSRELLAQLHRKGQVSESDAQAATERIDYTLSPEAFARRVDFVNESITEDLGLKRRVWSSFAGRWQPDTVLTTNTSYLLPSRMAEHSGDPARFCAFHFHDVFVARVVDVMPHPGTDPAVIPWLTALGRRLEQIPVHVERETSGYLFNFMLMACLGAAGALAVEGKANHEDIDRSWMGNLQTRIGPFGMMDQVGLDTVDKILSARSDPRSAAFRRLIAPLIARGHLGVKSGRGFYEYPRPAFRDPAFLT